MPENLTEMPGFRIVQGENIQLPRSGPPAGRGRFTTPTRIASASPQVGGADRAITMALGGAGAWWEEHAWPWLGIFPYSASELVTISFHHDEFGLT